VGIRDGPGRRYRQPRSAETSSLGSSARSAVGRTTSAATPNRTSVHRPRTAAGRTAAASWPGGPPSPLRPAAPCPPSPALACSPRRPPAGDLLAIVIGVLSLELLPPIRRAIRATTASALPPGPLPRQAGTPHPLGPSRAPGAWRRPAAGAPALRSLSRPPLRRVALHRHSLHRHWGLIPAAATQRVSSMLAVDHCGCGSGSGVSPKWTIYYMGRLPQGRHPSAVRLRRLIRPRNER
jgi:hypothetical protein